MRLLSTAALSLALAAAGGLMLPAAVSAAKKDEKAADNGAPKLTASAKFVKPAKAVQDLIAAKDYAGAMAKMPEAEAAASTPDDKYFVSTFYLNLGIGQNDQALQRKGLEGMLASGKVAPDLVGRYEMEAGKLAQVTKDIPAARDHYNKSIAAGTAGSDPYVMLAETYFADAYNNVEGNQLNATGKTLASQGLPYLKKAIEVDTAAGKAVPPEWYVRGMKMAVLSGDAGVGEWYKLTLAHAPTAENWRIVLRGVQDANKTLSSGENLDILRLMRQTKSLAGDYSYSEYSEAAWRAGLPGEVVSLIDTGAANGEIKKERYNDLYKLAQPAALKDKPTLAASEASAQKAATGKPAANTAMAYLSYGEAAKAIPLFKLALEKGGVDTNEVNTRLGIALAQTGDKAGAQAAFAAVTGTGLRKQIADLWTVYVKGNA